MQYINVEVSAQSFVFGCKNSTVIGVVPITHDKEYYNIKSAHHNIIICCIISLECLNLMKHYIYLRYNMRVIIYLRFKKQRHV